MGETKRVKKIKKPKITPVELNKEAQSSFAKAISNMEYPEIEPVFLDFSRDMSKFEIKQNIPVLYKRNTENELFSLSYVLNMGQNHNRELDTAMKYFSYLGTSKYTNKEFKQELFKNGCMLNVWASDDRIHISLYGLGEKLESVLRLLEDILSDAQPDKGALEKLVKDIIKERENKKLSKYQILRVAMDNYAMYGKQSPYTNILSTEELFELEAKELADIIKHITDYKHRIMYYGPHGKDELTGLLNKYHNVPGRLKAIPEGREFAQLPMKENIVYTCDYDMKQARIVFLSKSAVYNKKNFSVRKLFNEYYDGNMGSIVFQTLRESKALAYSVWAAYTTPDNNDEAHYIYSYIGTQADKMPEAMAGMYDLLNEFPESEICLKNSKEGIISKIRTERTTKDDILFEYEERERLGIEDYNIRENTYREVPTLQMNDLKDFFNRYIKGSKYAILVLGDKDKLDYDALAKYGRVKQLTLEEVFGY
jgi:predicted Zn-dependent peptidase